MLGVITYFLQILDNNTLQIKEAGIKNKEMATGQKRRSNNNKVLMGKKSCEQANVSR